MPTTGNTFIDPYTQAQFFIDAANNPQMMAAVGAASGQPPPAGAPGMGGPSLGSVLDPTTMKNLSGVRAPAAPNPNVPLASTPAVQLPRAVQPSGTILDLLREVPVLPVRK